MIGNYELEVSNFKVPLRSKSFFLKRKKNVRISRTYVISNSTITKLSANK